MKDAAFYYIYRMSHPSVSDYIVADPYCGSDPYGASHYTDAAASRYLEPNPQRGTDNVLWPTNDGIFKTFETARNHLDGGLKNVQVGYPQFYWEARRNLPRRLDATSPRPPLANSPRSRRWTKRRKSG